MSMTQQQLKELLFYDKETGNFYWRKTCNQRIKPWDIAGCVNGEGYVQISFLGKKLQVHRLAYLYMNGYMPKQVDHINGIRSDNRFANLREADNSKNSMNKGLQANNTTGFKGVSFHRNSNRFHAKICAGGVRRSLGYFETAEQAHPAYSAAAGELHGNFARTR